MAAEIQELLKVLGDLIGKMPDTALYILGGFFVFKMTFLLAPSWAGYKLIRLVVEKYHDIKSKPNEVLHKVDLNGIFISDISRNEVISLFSSIKNALNAHYGHQLSYIHENELKFMEQAVKEKIDRLKARNE